jgi:hypothetical protein
LRTTRISTQKSDIFAIDRFFLQEFALEEEKSHIRKNSTDLKKDLEGYGVVKESIRPTQKFMMNNPQASKPPMPSGLGYG